MERAPNLKAIVLKGQYCEDCNAISTAFGARGFPRNGDEQELVVDSIKKRFSSRSQIIFSGIQILL